MSNTHLKFNISPKYFWHAPLPTLLHTCSLPEISSWQLHSCNCLSQNLEVIFGSCLLLILCLQSTNNSCHSAFELYLKRCPQPGPTCCYPSLNYVALCVLLLRVSARLVPPLSSGLTQMSLSKCAILWQLYFKLQLPTPNTPSPLPRFLSLLPALTLYIIPLCFQGHLT